MSGFWNEYRLKSYSPKLKVFESFTPNKSLGNSLEPNLEPRVLKGFDVGKEYKEYLVNYKNKKIKKVYHLKLDEQILQVRNFNKAIFKELEDKKNQEKIEKKQKKLNQEILNKEKIFLENEKKKLEQAKTVELLKEKEKLLQQSFKDWMRVNQEKFEENKKKIEKEISEAKARQIIMAENRKVLNQTRYQAIRFEIEKNKEITRNIAFINVKRENFLKTIRERMLQEQNLNLPKINVADVIKEKLNESFKADDINKFFESED